jgi:hypothetical protein
MRTPRESLLFLGLLTAGCLLAGLVFGVATGRWVRPVHVAQTAPSATAEPPKATAAPAASVTPGDQKSLLVIGVTDATAATTHLEGCWVITFRAGVPEYYVLAFPPTATFYLSSLPGSKSLVDIYAEDLRLQLDHHFVQDAVEARFPGLSIQAALILDRSDLSALLGELGGLPVNNQVLTGPMLLQLYDTWRPAVNGDRSVFDGVVAQHMFDALIAKQWTPDDLAEFTDGLPHLTANPDGLQDLRRFLADAPPLAGSRLVWRQYSPELEVSTVP